MNKFTPSEFETKWQETWEKAGVYQPDIKNSKRPFYNLMMFPYPSAEGLHVGNMYAFTGADIFGRFMRMKGYDVFEPIGLDGFGIHSENYALKTGRHPSSQAKISEKNFYRQLRAIGNGFAWRNTLETYDPDYYRWTQWIFVAMFKNGLAYRKKSPVNFCPSCKTVLADEQVIEGACERCRSVVEKRQMEQWYFRITKYADRLLGNLDKLNWTNKVKIAQRNWIGKKEGISIKYQVSGIKYHLECFTTRPDTNFGATFVVIAPEHPFVAELLKTPGRCSEGIHPENSSRGTPSRWRNLQREIIDYVKKTKKKTPAERIAEGREKTGVFTGYYCVNQLNNCKMPLYISDFVLMEFGTGAVVGVPGHDRRDFEFAQKFNLPVIRVVVGKDGDSSPVKRPKQVQEEEGTMINSGFLDGLDIHLATQKMMDYIEEKGWGKRITTYHLRDWCISRQRYWGPPIPMIHCQKCADKGIGWLSLNRNNSQESRSKNQEARKVKKFHDSCSIIHNSDFMRGWFPVPEKDLPVILPLIQDYRPTGTGISPLASHKEFYTVACPNCGSEAQRETDVSDTFLDSAWYFLRYPSVSAPQPFSVYLQDEPPLKVRGGEGELPWDPEITRTWLPVNMYIGGVEHSVLHLLYSRFLIMALHDFGFLHFEEPFARFYAHGLIIAEGAKMSKSKGNIVIPDEYIKKYGSDALRTYLMFLGPFDQGGDFRDTGIAGMYRFLGRVWRLVNEYITRVSCIKYQVLSIKKENNNIPDTKYIIHNTTLTRFMHKTIKKVTQDLENLRYNTAIAHIMEFVNQLTDNRQQITDNNIRTLLLLLAPFAPHMTEELWQKLRHRESRIPSARTQGEDKNQESRKNNKILNTKYLILNTDSIHLHPWPSFDPKYLEEDQVTIVVQINGKVRETIQVKSQKSKVKSEVELEAKKSEKVRKYLEGKIIRKTIFVPGKLINFVV